MKINLEISTFKILRLKNSWYQKYKMVQILCKNLYISNMRIVLINSL
jgi:hypothetical protein